MGFSFRGYRQLFKFKIFGNTLTKKLGIFSLLALLTGQILPASQLPVSLAAVPSAVTIINSCNEANLLAALAVGGEITFSCSGSITLTTTPLNGISITRDTTLDGSGQNVTLDGGGARGIFSLSTPGLTLTLKNLTLAHAGTHGAINSQSANLNISHTTFINNTTDGSLGGGGALRFSQGSLNITNSLFISNTASSDGGAIFIGFGGVTNIVDSTFTGNSNPGIVGLEGGAIFNGGNLTVRNSTFNANNSTVNSSFGGAIANDNVGNLTVINSTFFGNGGRHGAAIFSPGPNARIINSTIVANGAAGDDGAVVYAEGSTLNVINSIIANNPPGNCFNFGTVGGHNNLETGPTTTCGTNSLLADPLLGPLADNGGPTQTLALLTGSRAINAADNAICQTAPPDGAGNLDQRGVLRPQGNGCDIGAFELELTPPALPAPSGLRASTFSPTRLDLSWQDNSTTESGFSLERKTGAGGTYAPVATLPTNTTTFSDNTVAADTTYFYRVQALQSGLVSAFSNEVKATSGATNLVVTLPSDDGSGTVAGSLSRALHQANPGQVITFNLNGGANAIAVSGSLPTSQVGISVDGGSCTTGAGGGPRITLDGSAMSGVVSGLQFNKGAVLKNIRLKGFGGRQLVVQSGGSSLRLTCVIASKT
jgi:hypothetical protein